MFDPSSNQASPDYRVRAHRTLPEPMPVWVRCDRLFLPRPGTMRDVPLWLRAYGINAGACVPGLLRSWHLLNTGGDFWGLVEFAVAARNGSQALELTELVPASILSPRDPDEHDPWASRPPSPRDG
ncbi:hypothetical protein [Saccharopolyspora endophytica]|uniref:Uncharacterized protein n=1 Tax=Saccharopolyspora endophytica TaxID=543886 RepID=A0ABS5DN70_9PSEU|nr:hypothetical protein [Saccharopolyspora endophytica]MBQ0927517.1 hypothetical protein [Saccharopolyspora endophytica]